MKSPHTGLNPNAVELDSNRIIDAGLLRDGTIFYTGNGKMYVCTRGTDQYCWGTRLIPGRRPEFSHEVSEKFSLPKAVGNDPSASAEPIFSTGYYYGSDGISWEDVDAVMELFRIPFQGYTIFTQEDACPEIVANRAVWIPGLSLNKLKKLLMVRVHNDRQLERLKDFYWLIAFDRQQALKNKILKISSELTAQGQPKLVAFNDESVFSLLLQIKTAIRDNDPAPYSNNPVVISKTEALKAEVARQISVTS